MRPAATGRCLPATVLHARTCGSCKSSRPAVVRTGYLGRIAGPVCRPPQDMPHRSYRWRETRSPCPGHSSRALRRRRSRRRRFHRRAFRRRCQRVLRCRLRVPPNPPRSPRRHLRCQQAALPSRHRFLHHGHRPGPRFRSGRSHHFHPARLRRSRQIGRSRPPPLLPFHRCPACRHRTISQRRRRTRCQWTPPGAAETGEATFGAGRW